MKSYLFFLIILSSLVSSVTMAQKVDISNDSIILKQFDEVIEKTSSYQFYKVVPKKKLIELKDIVLDFFNEQEKSISDKNKVIEANNQKISELNQKISALESDFKSFREEKESMNLLGISMHKSMYSLVMWLLVIFLLGLVAWYFYKFSKSNVITKKSVKDLEELQKEYDEHRRVALEREQKVRRQLQDEINKNRGI